MLSGKKGTSSSAGAHNDLSFGLHLSQKLDPLGNDESALLSQLAGMLQAGTPLATIVDRLAKALSNALASATGNQGNADRQRTLERALASALAPPGASPPGQRGTAKVPIASTALSLGRRLDELVSRISRELQTAGQQNRFSGTVLDANSAREIPAPQVKQHPTGTQAPAGSVALAQSILRDVVAQLQNAASSQQQQPAPVQTATVQGASPSASAQAAQITVRSPDVLGRMLARAAKADPVAAAPPANPLGSSGSAASASDLFARLIDVIAQATNEQSASGKGKEGSQQFASSKNDLAAIHHASGTATTATPAPAFSSALNAATAPAAQASSAPLPYTVDPQSVIEQVVKGIVLRNFGTTSEVRMRLQPEHLGDVALKLTVSGNTVSANIVAQNPDVRNLLLGNQQQLARALAEAGLSLGSFSVDVSGGNPGFSQRQAPQHRSVLKTGALDAGSAAEDDTWADARFGPPVLTGAKSLVLNYLA